MYYTFLTAQPQARNITFNDLFNNRDFTLPVSSGYKHTYTHFIPDEELTPTKIFLLRERYNALQMELDLNTFQNRYQHLLVEDMSIHYDTFNIPKRSGGYRTINAPKPELMDALTELKQLFEYKLHILAHDTAFAYIKERSTKDALEMHKANNSNWFLKLDVKSFFPSCNRLFIMRQLKKIFPFSVLSPTTVKNALQFCIKLSLLNDELPQGTPMSPALTNLIMIPIDHKLVKLIHQQTPRDMVYTRYADDLLFSSKLDFNPESMEEKVNKIFKEEKAPFKIKHEKTRYGSSSGRNWNLGLMYNKEHQITTGHKQKKRLKAAINNFFTDLTNNVIWSRLDIQILIGNISYNRSIEKEYTEYIVNHYNAKFNRNLMQETKRLLSLTI